MNASMRRGLISLAWFAAASAPAFCMYTYLDGQWTPPTSRFAWLALAVAGGVLAAAAPRTPGRAGVALYVILGTISVAGWCAVAVVWYGWDQYGRQIRTDALLSRHAALVITFQRSHHVLPTQSQWQGLAKRADPPLALEDAWGHPLLYAIGTQDGESTFVLASSGRDESLDVAQITDYIGRTRSHNEYNSDRDLVNVGGERIVHAGK